MSIRALLSFFRPSKASVEPVSRTDDPGSTATAIRTGFFASLTHEQQIAALSYRGPETHPPAPDVLVKREHTFLVAADHDFTSWKPDPSAGSASLAVDLNPYQSAPKPPQHPLAPEIAPPPLDWDVWTRMASENQRRGWSFCRYAVKFADRMACVFGIVRGPWGICTMDFYICGADTFDTLNAVTHLPSGMGCGLFTDQESAATACDIAARLADDWETLDPYADASATRGALDRMHSAWAAAGLTKCATHAHADAGHNTTPIPIWFQDYGTIIAGRPEKLS